MLRLACVVVAVLCGLCDGHDGVPGVAQQRRDVPQNMFPTHSSVHAECPEAVPETACSWWPQEASSGVGTGSAGVPLAVHDDEGVRCDVSEAASAWPLPDRGLFPEFYAVEPRLRVVLEAGDMLVIPSEWWHWVVSAEEETVAFNTWTSVQDEAVELRVVRGGAADWPARTLWTPERLQQLASDGAFVEDTSMAVCTRSRNVYPEDVVAGRHPEIYGQANLSLVFDRLVAVPQSSPWPVCYAMLEVPPESPLFGAVRLPKEFASAIDAGEFSWSNLWVSRGRVQSGLHYDQWPNVLSVLRGRKSVTLFSPDQSPHLYPVSAWDYLTNPEERRKAMEEALSVHDNEEGDEEQDQVRGEFKIIYKDDHKQRTEL